MSDQSMAPASPGGLGQANVLPTKGTEATISQAPFYEHEWEEGNKAGMKPGKETFRTKEDLARRLREGTLHHAGFTLRAQEIAKQREQMSKREKEIEQMAADLMEKRSRIDPMDKFLTERKDIADYIATQMRQPSNQAQQDQFKKLIEEYTKPLQEKLSEAEKWKKDQDDLNRKEQLYFGLSKQYPDFHRPTVSGILQQLEQTPEGDEDRALMELAYWAAKGRNGTVAPVVVEQKAAELAAKKVGRTSPVPSSNASPVPASTDTPKSIRDAVNQYKQRHSA